MSNMAVNGEKRKRNKQQNRQTKLNLVFDETKRRDFLTGFRKRKLQRKKQAQEQLEKDLKEERKRLKVQAKENFKNLVSQRTIPEIETLLAKEEYEEDDVTVKVIELSTEDMAERNHWIGANKPQYSEVNQEPTFNSEKQVKQQLKKQATKNVQKSKVFQKKGDIEKRKQKKQSLRAKKLKDNIKSKSKKNKHRNK